MKGKKIKKITLGLTVLAALGCTLFGVGNARPSSTKQTAEAAIATTSASFIAEDTALYPETQEGSFSDAYAAAQERYLYSRIALEKDGVSIRDVTKGATEKHRSRIVVIDSGVKYDHEDFLAEDGSVRFSPLSYNVTMKKTVAEAGYHILSDSEAVDGHGTQVCGTIFAVGDNGKGIAGLAEDAELIFVKVTPTSEGAYDGNEINAALEYAATLNADVVNLSMGNYLTSNPYASSIRKIYNSGAVIVAAAGNVSKSDYHYPSADANVIAVGSFANAYNLPTTTTEYSLANYSTFGDHNLTVCAPGTFYTTKMDGTYGIGNGTSVATPVVSSAVALYRSLYPDSTVKEVMEALCASASDQGDYGRDYKFGYGGLNVYDFLFGERGEVVFDFGNGRTETRTVNEGTPLQNYPFPTAEDAPTGKEFAGWWLDKAGTKPISYYQDVLPIGTTVYAKWRAVGADGLSDGSGTDGNALDYTLNTNGKLVVKGYYGKGERLVLPKKISVGNSEYETAEIAARAFQKNATLQKIILPSSVTAVREYAFADSTYRYVYIPSSVTKVEKHAMHSSKGTLYVQDKTGTSSFTEGWDSLAKVDVVSDVTGVSITDGMELVVVGQAATLLSYEGKERVVTLTGDYPVVEIAENAFSANTVLEKINAPDVVTIGNAAFNGCTSLTQVSLPSVVTIGEKAFYGCSALTHVDFPVCLKTVGNSAFADCVSLVRFTLADGAELTEINDYAFDGCTALETVDLQRAVSLTYVGTNAFNSAKTAFLVYIPDGVKTIGYNAFGGLETVTSVRLPFLGRGVVESYTNFGYAFGASNVDLQAAVVPENLQYLYVSGSVQKGALNGVTGVTVFAEGDCPAVTDCTVYDGGAYAFVHVYADGRLVGMLGGKAGETLQEDVLNAAYRLPDGYTFTAWDADVSSLPAQNGVSAWNILSDKETYTVEFYTENGSLINRGSYRYGEEITVPTAPQKAATERYEYRFVGWGKPVTVAMANATYTAKYESVIRTYPVRFYADNGDLLAEAEYAYGETPVAPTVQDRIIDVQYYDKFSGWDKTVASVTGATEYTAVFIKTEREYLVQFAYEDGTVFAEEYYRYGATVEAPNTTRAADERYSYTFSGWATPFESVTQDVTYTAKYQRTPVEYTVTFLDYKDDVIQTQALQYGQMPTPPDAPVRADAPDGYRYVFLGWGQEIAAVTENVTYKATYKLESMKIVITFLNYDGSVLSEAEYNVGETVVAPPTPTRTVSSKSYYYEFKGWDSEVTAATEAKTYTATYERKYYEFTVTFVDYDGTVLSTETSLRYDATVTPPTVQQREGYTFIGWDKEVTKVTENATYTAVYEQTELPPQTSDESESSSATESSEDEPTSDVESREESSETESSETQISESESSATESSTQESVSSTPSQENTSSSQNTQDKGKKGCGSVAHFSVFTVLLCGAFAIGRRKHKNL